MEAIAANKVLFFNSNALSMSRIRYRRHHHKFVCCIQSRDNHLFKLGTSEETHIVKPVLKPLTLKPKPKRIPKLVELTFHGIVLFAIVGLGWIFNVILPKTYNNMIVSNSEFDCVAYAYTSGEFEALVIAMIIWAMKLCGIHEEACLNNRKNSRTLKALGVFLICLFVGCSLRLVSLAYVRDTLLRSRGHAPWHLILVLFIIVLKISLLGVSVIDDIRKLENRVSTQICDGSGTQARDLNSRSRERPRRPLEKSRRRGIIMLNKHLGRVSGLGGHIRSPAEEEQ